MNHVQLDKIKNKKFIFIMYYNTFIFITIMSKQCLFVKLILQLSVESCLRFIMHIWPSKPCGKSIRQVLQTIIIDVVQRCPILPESAYYSRRQREMLKDIHEYIIQTFNMLYAERLIWYCFGALDLTFNPWGTLYKIKTTCVFMFTFKHKKNTKENRRS